MSKICPFMSKPLKQVTDESGKHDYFVECQKQKCALWVRPYSTEDISQDGMCAFEMMAMKNSEGKYVVWGGEYHGKRKEVLS